MRWVALALCACNQVYGSSPVGTIDARFYDAPTDAVPHCPTTSGLPVFSPKLHVDIDQSCATYEISADRDEAVAICIDANTATVSEGHIDQPMSPIAVVPASTVELSINSPRLSPEGDLLEVSTFDISATVSAFTTYNFDGTSWARGDDLPLPQFGSISTLSRGPQRRLIYYGSEATGEEYGQDATGAWVALRPVAVGEPYLSHYVYLSPDALRLVIYETGGVDSMAATYYADRPDRDSDFSALRVLAAVPPGELFLTETCSRVYVSSVDEVFYANGE